MDKVRYFRNGAAFGEWLKKNSAKSTELWLGFYKVDSGKKGVSYKEALDEALCYGWIDGIRKPVDELSYKIRFTPRNERSLWSKINVNRVRELEALGRMTPEGLRLFELRKDRDGYSIKERSNQFPPEYEAEFRKYPEAWARFQKMPPSHQRQYIHWISNAKQEETRRRRLERTISSCAPPIGKL